MQFLQELPSEILNHIFEIGLENNILDIPDLQNCFLVSKKLKEVAKTMHLWRFIAFKIIKFVELSKGLEIGIDLSQEVDGWKKFKEKIEKIVRSSKNKHKYKKSFNIENIIAIKNLEEEPLDSMHCTAMSSYRNYDDFYIEQARARLINPPCMGNLDDIY